MKAFGCSTMLAALLLLVLAATRVAGEPVDSFDQEPGNINWDAVPEWSTTSHPYIDTNGYLQSFEVLTVRVIGQFISTHCQTDQGTGIKHYHHQFDFDGQNGRPSQAQVKAHWDYRFGLYMDLPITGGNGPTLKANCATHAFSETATAGPSTPAYNYWVLDSVTAFNQDYLARGYNYQIQPDDLLRHVAQHVSIVKGVKNQRPSTVEFKFRASGIYTYVPPDAAKSWNLPFVTCWVPQWTLTQNEEHDGAWQWDILNGTPEVHYPDPAQ